MCTQRNVMRAELYQALTQCAKRMQGTQCTRDSHAVPQPVLGFFFFVERISAQ